VDADWRQSGDSYKHRWVYVYCTCNTCTYSTYLNIYFATTFILRWVLRVDWRGDCSQSSHTIHLVLPFPSLSTSFYLFVPLPISFYYFPPQSVLHVQCIPM
jgi:hypothetical protein